MARIDLNADVGESLGTWRIGDDETLIPLVSSVNIACGFHAGDPLTIERTVRLAVEAGAEIGAHPGYPDLIGFGRREMTIARDELEAAVLYQVGAVAAFASAAGRDLRHVKAHGALYNQAAREPGVAEAVARGVRRWSRDVTLVGLAGSVLLSAGEAAGLRVAGEAFPDRSYEPDGRLQARRHRDALVLDAAVVAARAVGIARDGSVEAVDGTLVRIDAATLCIHGDMAGATERARAVREALQAAGIEIRALGS